MKTRGTALDLLISGVCISLIAIFLSGCSGSGGGGGGSGNLYGTVINLSYNPVSNADVVVDSAAAKTLSNGTYSFINLPSGRKIIRITSIAHTPSYRQVSFSGGQSVNAGIAILADLDSKVTPILKAAGGTATNTNGSIKIVFPINSVTQETTSVVLTAVPKVAAPYNPPSGDQFISYIVYAKPENMSLTSSAELSVPNLTGVPATFEVKFYNFNTDTLDWEPLPGHGHSTTETDTIDINISKLGWIAAIMLITPAPGWIEGTVTSSSVPVAGVNVWTMTSYDVTDSSGSYRLNDIPVGTTEVYASALGYQLYTSPVQTITTNHSTTLPIGLTPLNQGNIAGTVKDLIDNTPISARIIGSKGGVAYTDDYGRYTLYNIPADVPPASTEITAYSDGHISSSEFRSVISGSTVSDVNFGLPFVGAAASYEFNFENTTEGFTTMADSVGHNFWHVQYYNVLRNIDNPISYFNLPHGAVTQKVYLTDDGIIPTPESGSYYFWYGQTSPDTVEASYIGEQAPSDVATTESGTGGISSYFNGNQGTLESPSLDLRGYSFGKLSFWTWWEIEGKNPATGKDAMCVYASEGPPFDTWDLLGCLNPYEDPAKTLTISGEAYTSGGFNQPGAWVQHSFDLSPYAGHTIRLRFEFDTDDDLYNGFRGWFLDNIKIENSQMGIFGFGHYRRERPIPMPRKR